MARGFIPHSNSDGRVQPWEYLPASAITPKIGQALVLSSGQLAVAGGTAKPAYICMTEAASAVTAGTVIPVIKVEPDMVFECTNSASLADVSIGARVQTTNGLQVTASTTNGVATIVDKTAGSGTNNPTLVRFE